MNESGGRAIWGQCPGGARRALPDRNGLVSCVESLLSSWWLVRFERNVEVPMRGVMLPAHLSLQTVCDRIRAAFDAVAKCVATQAWQALDVHELA